MTSNQSQARDIDIEGGLASTVFALFLLGICIPAVASIHLFMLVAATLAVLSGVYSTVCEIFVRPGSRVALVVPVLYIAGGAYVLFHLPPQ
jgi:hypothetical protein